MAKDSDNRQDGTFKRRQFIKTTATLASGVALAGSSVPGAAEAASKTSCKTPGCDYDVIVIGGGNAGAAAARDSMKNGYKTLLLEAGGRLGGRTFTADFHGTRIELGGTWVYNNQPFVWAEIERYGLEIEETPGAMPDAMYMIMKDGERLSFTEAELLEALAGWEQFTAAARTALAPAASASARRAGPSAPAAGYEPRNFTSPWVDLRIRRQSATTSSATWPSRSSTKQ